MLQKPKYNKPIKHQSNAATFKLVDRLYQFLHIALEFNILPQFRRVTQQNLQRQRRGDHMREADIFFN